MWSCNVCYSSYVCIIRVMKLRDVIQKTVIFNTIKIAGAAILAILTATALDLEFAVSAGIVAVLTIQPTKKETIRTAVGRLFAFAGIVQWR